MGGFKKVDGWEGTSFYKKKYANFTSFTSQI